MKVTLQMTQEEMQSTQLGLLCDIYSQQKALFKAVCIVLGKGHEMFSYLTIDTSPLDRKMFMETGSEREDKALRIMAENAAMLHGLTAIVIDAIAQNEYQADELRKTVHEFSQEDYRDTMNHLWAEKGKLNLNELL